MRMIDRIVRRSPRAAAVLAATLMIVCAAKGRSAEPTEELTPEQVRAAIDFGISYLSRRQKPDGSWPDYGGMVGGGIVFPGGSTALCTLAMLSAGVPADDPRMKAALTRLESYRPQTTYVVALQTLAFCQANPRQYLTRIQANVNWLEAAQITTGPNKGAWSYRAGGSEGGDNSNSQFALLALHEAERAGATVKRETWTSAKAYWEDAQNLDGSWGYHKRTLGTGSMTCAGIASLIITSDRFRLPNAEVQGDQILCCRKPADDGAHRIENGLAWLGRNFRVSGNPGAPGNMWLLYYLYGVERVGRMTNQRYFYEADGTPRDWYREGAAQLIRMRGALETTWIGSGAGERDPDISTAFALLFLAKGRRPILLAKLQHGPEDDWNHHRSDVDNLTRFVETQWRRDLTWQVVELRRATIEDLLQSPVIVLSGALNPLPAETVEREKLAAKLRGYLDRGGFLVAEADCNSPDFDRGFRELMKLTFPEPEYQLSLLPPEHPIWRAERPVPPTHVRPLWGIDYGCRTSVVYAAPDPARARPTLSCLWELSRPGRDVSYSRAVRDQIDAALTIGINILAYATNRELKGKEENFRVTAVPRKANLTRRNAVAVAKLRHPGGCNAAPRALLNLLELAGSGEARLNTLPESPLIDITDPSLFEYHLVFMHGRNGFQWTETERKQLRAYIERGGMLFADAICSSSAFIESFRREMTLLFPDRKLERIPSSDEIFSTRYGGHAIRSVRRREPPRGDGAGGAIREVPPELEGIRFDDRWGIVFSQYDISCALEKRQTLECRGYLPEDAARLGLNILLYSLYQ